MPDHEKAATRYCSAKNGAMKLHQSACAPLPCRKRSPGLPRSPQVSISIFAPSTVTNERSGAISSARVNHAGASGLAPWRNPRSDAGLASSKVGLRRGAAVLSRLALRRNQPTGFGELGEVVVGVAEGEVDYGDALEVVADLELLRHPDAAVQLDRVLADEAPRA